MSSRVLKEALPDERFTQQELDIFLGPVPRGQCLKEHHDFLCGISHRLDIVHMQLCLPGNPSSPTDPSILPEMQRIHIGETARSPAPRPAMVVSTQNDNLPL